MKRHAAAEPKRGTKNAAKNATKNAAKHATKNARRAPEGGKAAKARASIPTGAVVHDHPPTEPPPPAVRRGRSDDGTAFMPDPEDGPARINDSLAETLAEEYLESATRGEDAVEDTLEEVVPEELGGPFVETTAADEFADGVDGANPEDAEVEPLPRPVAGLVQAPPERDDLG
jgi:hypothetical protein